MKVGYVRVSTTDQNPARQMELMESLGVEKVFCDKMSGKNTEREQFQDMMAFLREGDVLYIESFSRLSRSTRDLLATVDALAQNGVTLISQKENLNTDTPQGRFMLTVFAAMAEMERESILERQREGIEVAKAQNKYKGRKPIEVSERFFTVANAWACGKMQLKTAICESGMSESTFFRNCRKYGISKASSKSSGKSKIA